MYPHLYPGRGKGFLSSPKYPDRLRDSPSLLFNRYRGLSRRESSRGLMLTTHLRMAPRLRTSGAILLPPLIRHHDVERDKFFTSTSMYFYCIFMYLRASWHYSATLTEIFPCFFLSCKANARVKPANTGHGPHSSKIFVLFCVFFVLCRSMYCLCVNVYCTTATGWLPNCS